MMRVVLKRLALAPVLLFLASLVAFSFPWLTGVDPAEATLSARLPERAPDEELIRQIEADLGLDRPVPVQYASWVGDLVRGDLGFSYVDREAVGAKLSQGLAVTGSLVALALGLGAGVGVALGVVAASRKGFVDALITNLSQLGVMVPEYVVGPGLVLVFALGLGVLPVAGWSGLAHVVLPVLTLAAPVTAISAQLTRSEVTDALAHPSIAVARAKGAANRRVLWRHALPNALTSVTAVLGLWTASILGGSVIVEVIFDIPGLGRVLYNAVLSGDLPVIQGGIVLMVLVAIVVNLVSDLLQAAADPLQRV